MLVETAGIGQSDSEIVDLADVSVYVMTPDYGAPSQLEKIDMLDFADLVVLNKSDRRGAQDALRDVRKQWRRNRGGEAGTPDAALPVFPTIARALERPGRRRALRGAPREARRDARAAPAAPRRGRRAARSSSCPGRARRYLAEIAETVRGYRARTEAQAERASDAWGLEPRARAARGRARGRAERARGERASAPSRAARPGRSARELEGWPALEARYRGRDQELRGARPRVTASRTTRESLSGTAIPKVALPRDADWGARARFLRLENLPGRFPFTAGVFPFKRDDEDPTRMFAGEGGPERTNRRFHLLTAGQTARAALDRVRQRDALRAGPRRAARRLRQGRQLRRLGLHASTTRRSSTRASTSARPNTSVSMTINGPAPIVLAFFLNAAIDQAVERDLRADGRARGGARALRRRTARCPSYDGDAAAPATTASASALLGIPGDRAGRRRDATRASAPTCSRASAARCRPTS